MYQPYPDQPPPYASNYPSAPVGAPQPGFAPVNMPATLPVYNSYSASPQPQVIVQQPPTTTIIVGQMFYGPYPQQSTCLNCQKAVMSRTVPTTGSLTWMMCIILAFMGLDCGCCLIPFACDSCKDIEHYCPECGQFMGVYNRGGRRY
ncbi:cell death-inducing p53-target protein 1-like isoform X1 [Leptotrombidium deliense]|uniref:Cell death-inducing p53-target protein 1-like isoform X1 n=1 Tax=Leptotrombidium deliense TaxID=299467 RepID=A0A443S9B3_9ACAR|nr:cell death-inducing p53-target protein 1-like isoform X1 [Leptotrombidium deliense]